MADATYRVVDQERDTAVTANGKVERGWRVYYKDGLTGVDGDVFVPDSQYSEDNVRALIEHALTSVRAVHNLGS